MPLTRRHCFRSSCLIRRIDIILFLSLFPLDDPTVWLRKNSWSLFFIQFTSHHELGRYFVYPRPNRIVIETNCAFRHIVCRANVRTAFAFFLLFLCPFVVMSASNQTKMELNSPCTHSKQCKNAIENSECTAYNRCKCLVNYGPSTDRRRCRKSKKLGLNCSIPYDSCFSDSLECHPALRICVCALGFR